MLDIVIDIETLGTRPGCPIIEIGACAMDPDTGRIVGCFGRRIGFTLCYGDLLYMYSMAAMPPDMMATVKWWTGDKERDAVLRKLLARPTRGMRAPLEQFCAWVRLIAPDNGGARVWGNGPTFDLSILIAQLDAYGIGLPWRCDLERCVRTALDIAGCERGSVEWAERGPRHRALNDARHEARKLFYSGALGEVSAIVKRLRQRGMIKGEVR